MFDIAWSEMALIAAVALIVIGPKELPRVLRQVGIWTRKLKLLAGEFQRNLDDMVREAELDEVRRDIEKVGRTDLNRVVENTIDPTGEAAKALRLDDDKPDLAKIDLAAPEPPPVATPEQPDDKAPKP